MLYAAYGSNLNIKQMGWRCPSARVIGIGFIKGYRLEFRKFLTIVPDPKSDVPVALWEISEKDEKALDRYEGYPQLYRKEIISVENKFGYVDALVYIMNGGELQLPTVSYLTCVREGYEQIGLDDFYLKEALNRCTE